MTRTIDLEDLVIFFPISVWPLANLLWVTMMMVVKFIMSPRPVISEMVRIRWALRQSETSIGENWPMGGQREQQAQTVGKWPDQEQSAWTMERNISQETRNGNKMITHSPPDVGRFIMGGMISSPKALSFVFALWIFHICITLFGLGLKYISFKSFDNSFLLADWH